MHLNDQVYKKVKKKYLKFLKSQEIQSEPFRDKLGQLNNFFLPICEKIYKNFINGKKTKVKKIHENVRGRLIRKQ